VQPPEINPRSVQSSADQEVACMSRRLSCYISECTQPQIAEYRSSLGALNLRTNRCFMELFSAFFQLAVGSEVGNRLEEP
jgi:hypothetical protein